MNAICPNGHAFHYRHARGTRMAEITCPVCGSGGIRRSIYIWCDQCERSAPWSKYPRGHYVAPDAQTCPNGHPIDLTLNSHLAARRQHKPSPRVRCTVCGRLRGLRSVVYAPREGLYRVKVGSLPDGRGSVHLRLGDPVCWHVHGLDMDAHEWLKTPPGLG